MTVKECYELLGGSYEEAKGRLMSDRLVEKFMLKFPQDKTMSELEATLAAEDYEAAFRAAHTLKGVAANLAFSDLHTSASELTEAMRNNKTAPDTALVQKVREDYAKIMDALTAYQGV